MSYGYPSDSHYSRSGYPEQVPYAPVSAYGRTSARPDEYVNAQLWRRFVARIIDTIFFYGMCFVLILPVCVLILPIFIPFVIITDEGSGGRNVVDDAATAVGVTIILLLAFVGIEVLLLVRRNGQTLGKGLMSLRVIREDKRAATVPWASASIRMVLMLLLTYSGILIPVNGVVAILDGKRRAIHDRAAGTRVVRAPKRGLKPSADLMMALPVPQRVSLAKRA